MAFQKNEVLIKYSMDYLATETLAFIKVNPGWATLVIGLTAFGESFVFLSLLFPGTAILVASGALMSKGLLDPILPIIAGIVGAVLGDAVSFWLGQKFGHFFQRFGHSGAVPSALRAVFDFSRAMAEAASSSVDSSDLYARWCPWRQA